MRVPIVKSCDRLVVPRRRGRRNGSLVADVSHGMLFAAIVRPFVA